MVPFLCITCNQQFACLYSTDNFFRPLHNTRCARYLLSTSNLQDMVDEGLPGFHLYLMWHIGRNHYDIPR